MKLKRRTNIISFVEEANLMRNPAVLEGIQAGLADIEAGRLYTHEEVMAHIKETLAALRNQKSS